MKDFHAPIGTMKVFTNTSGSKMKRITFADQKKLKNTLQKFHFFSEMSINLYDMSLHKASYLNIRYYSVFNVINSLTFRGDRVSSALVLHERF